MYKEPEEIRDYDSDKIPQISRSECAHRDVRGVCTFKEESLSITVFFGITKVLRGKPWCWYGKVATGGDLDVKKENGISPIS